MSTHVSYSTIKFQTRPTAHLVVKAGRKGPKHLPNLGQGPELSLNDTIMLHFSEAFQFESSGGLKDYTDGSSTTDREEANAGNKYNRGLFICSQTNLCCFNQQAANRSNTLIQYININVNFAVKRSNFS